MDIESLAEWHREQAKKLRGDFRRRIDVSKEIAEKVQWHLDAANLIESFSEGYHKRRLAETERDVLLRAIESFERSAKSLIGDSKDLKTMFSQKFG